MRVVIQRVSEANVVIDNKIYSEIGDGLMVLVGICSDDNDEDISWVCNKIVNLRIFPDEAGIMNRSVKDISGEILAVSQFTLMAMTKHGNRPSYINAAPHNISIPLYDKFVAKLEELLAKRVKTGEFGADMKVSLVNEGPTTIYIDTKNRE